MTKDDALKLALVVLRNSQDYKQGRASVVEAVEDIKEALTQPSDSVEKPVNFELAYGEIYKDQRSSLAKALAQPERPWVGLTDEEVMSMDAYTTSNSSFYAGALWAEAKLKEKNT